MFGTFFHGKCNLSEAFWKFSVLGLAISAFITRMLMSFLRQSANYEPRFFKIVLNNISLLSMNSTTFMWLCFYSASFIAVIVYAFICIVGMWNTYKEYEKSKILALICMLLVWGLAYIAVKTSIY